MVVLLLASLLPVLAGCLLLIFHKFCKRPFTLGASFLVMVISAVSFAVAATKELGVRYKLFSLSSVLEISLRLDRVGVLFGSLAVIVFLAALVFAFEYMKHEEREERYFGFYLIVFGVLMFLCSAGNMITFYFCFELLTLTSMPLVLHNQSHEAVMAGLKYLLYSLCGAYAALFGIYFISKYGMTLNFGMGSVFDAGVLARNQGLFLVVAMVMILGFGVKAGMFPMHAWLTSAHPVAPAPASCVLSAVIAKAGVLAIVRVIYDMFGTEFLRGTWVQKAMLSLTLVTVFLGSMLAYGEPVMKKRLAYSTISQVSYILFGLAVMGEKAFSGSMLHVLSHGLIKAVLFLCAGAIIYKTGKTRVDQLRGIGKEMPVTIWCYTIAALGLIGIPPTGGFLSKWYLALGALSEDIGFFSWFGVIVLLVSALLTAGYLLPVTIMGFLPGNEFNYSNLKKKEPNFLMTVPLIVLTVLILVLGIFPQGVLRYITNMYW